MASEMVAFGEALRDGKEPNLGTDPLAAISEQGKAVWAERFSTLDRQTFQRTLGTTIVTYLAHRKQSIGILPSCVCASLAGTRAQLPGVPFAARTRHRRIPAQGHAERPRRRMELYPQDFPCRYKSQQRLSQKENEDIGYFRDMAEVNAFLETINTQGQRAPHRIRRPIAARRAS